MNYQEINSAIIEGRDVNGQLVTKDQTFYDYLLSNKVAYYYAKDLSKNQTEIEAKIIARGDTFNADYIKTVGYVKDVCEQEKIPFLIFKTHRYISGAVDGDIDLLVHAEDFQRFLDAFAARDFEAVEDEPQKGKCTKDGYISIEPHVNISWRDNIFLPGQQAWENSTMVSYGDLKIPCCSPTVEMLAAAGELYFSPEYIDLFRVKSAAVLTGSRGYTTQVQDVTAHALLDQYMVWLAHVTTQEVGRKLPYFLPSLALDGAIRAHVSGKERAEIVFKNFCWEYRYKLINRLPFTHDWNI